MININQTIFYEKINFVKLKYIIDHKSDFEVIIENDKTDNDVDNKKASIWAIMKKMYKQIEQIPFSEFGYIKVKYQKGKTCNYIGRWYSENSIGLAPMKSCIRGTICDNQWVDIDQVNSHPTILKQIMDKKEFSSPILNKCVNNREELLKIIMKEENISRDSAKDHIISVINGKKYKSNTLLSLHNELKIAVESLMRCDEYNHIYNYCKNTFGDKCNIWGKTISRILQFEENKMLECYINYCYDNGYIDEYKNGLKVALVFDGFQLMKNDNININEELLNNLRLYALEQTGFDIELKFKPFDNPLKIPDDYNKVDITNNKDEEEEDYIDPSIKCYDDVKEDFEKNHCKIMFPPCIHTDDILNQDDELQNFKQAKDTFSHIKCYIVEGKKKIVKQFINVWLSDPNIKIYNKITWKPYPLTCNSNVYNKWSDFEISTKPLTITKRDYWNEYLDFCFNLFETKQVALYIIARYAFRVQNPGLRTKVCVIYYGPEGIGKSTFIETTYKVFGKFVVFIDKAKKIYENHSTFEKEKIFICVNEASGTDNFENSEVLKTRITESKLYINPKGIQAYEIDNLCDYDMTTNNINVVKITDDSERRWFETEISNYYADNIEFFVDFNDNILNNDEAIRQIYEGFLNYDWKSIIKSGNFQDKNYKPYTNITKCVKESNRDKLIYFFKDIIDDHYENNKDNNTIINLKKYELFQLWDNWCSRCKIKMELNNIQFGIRITQLNNKVKCKTGQDFTTKDTHQNIYIDGSVFNNFIHILDLS